MNEPQKFARPADEPIFTWNSRLVVGFIVAGFVIIGLVLTLSFGVMAWGFLIATMAGCMLLGYPRVLLATYWVWVVVYQYVSTLYMNAFTKWSDEVLTVMMLGILLMHYMQNRLLFSKLRTLNRMVLGLIALIFVSTIVNQVPKVLVLHFILQYLRMFLLFYFAYTFIQPRQARTVFWIIAVMIGLQYAMNFAWYFRINPLPNWMGGADFAIGTGIGANVCAYYSIAGLFLATSYSLHSRSFLRRLAGVGFFLATLVHLFITVTYHAYAIFAICLPLYAWLLFREFRTRVVAAFALGAVLLTVVLAVLPQVYFEQIVAELDPRGLQQRINNLRYGPKGQSYVANMTALPQETTVPYFGAGPASAGSMVARVNRRPLADKYFTWVDLSVERQNISGGGSILGGPSTGILAIWSELGVVGTILYWTPHIMVLRRVVRGLRKKWYLGRYKLILAEAFVPTMVMYLLLSTIADFCWLVYVNAIWIWAGLLWRYDAGPEGPAQPEATPPAKANQVLRTTAA